MADPAGIPAPSPMDETIQKMVANPGFKKLTMPDPTTGQIPEDRARIARKVIDKMFSDNADYANATPPQKMAVSRKLLGPYGYGDLFPRMDTAATPPPTEGTGKPLDIVPLDKAFAGDTFRLQMMRSGPNPGKSVGDYLKSKGYQPVPGVAEGAPGQALWQGPAGIVNAGETMLGPATAAGAGPIAVGTAAQLGTEAAGAPPVIGGAVGNVASDMYDQALRRVMGIPHEPITAQGIGTSAALGAAGAALPVVAEAASGLRGARNVVQGATEKALGEGEELATRQAATRGEVTAQRGIAAQSAADSARTQSQKELETLVNRQAEIAGDLSSKNQEARSQAQKEYDALSVRKAQIRDEMAAKRGAAAQGALDTPIGDAGVGAAQAKVRDLTTKGLEKARPDAAVSESERLLTGMLDKTPADAARERALPEDIAANRLASSKTTYFDSLTKIREARQQPFEEALKPVQKTAIAPEDLETLQKTSQEILNTPGLNVRSTELKTALNRFAKAGGEGDVAQNAAMKKMFPDMSDEQIAGMKPETKANYIKNAPTGFLKAGEGGGAPTYGEAWRLRNDAWNVVRKSNDPEERAAAHEFINKADDIFDRVAPVDAGSKARYGQYKSTFTPALTRKIGQAKTVGEVGSAIFGSSDQTALQVIDNAADRPRLQDTFAHYVREQDLPASKVVSNTNPTVLRKLYGADAEPLLKLGGKDLDVKGASWRRIISASPEGKAAFEKSLRDTLQTQQVQEGRMAVQEGLKAAESLPKTQHEAVMRAVAAVKTPQEKLAILDKSLPGSESVDIQPTAKQAGILNQPRPDPDAAARSAGRKAFATFETPASARNILEKQPPDPRAAAVNALGSKGIDSPMQRYFKRRLAFMAMGAALTGGGIYSGRGQLVEGGLALMAPNMATGFLLSNPKIAGAYVDALNNPVNRFSTLKLGQVIGSLITQTAAQNAKWAINEAPPDEQVPK